MVADPRADHQPLTEASCVNPLTIALCHVYASELGGRRHPHSDKGAHSAGLVWVLAQEVPHVCGIVSRESSWEGLPDLYLC